MGKTKQREKNIVRKPQAFKFRDLDYKDKGECQRLHFLKRARQRFDIHFTEKHYSDIIKAMTEHNVDYIEAVFKCKQSARINIYLIYIPSIRLEPFEVCYDTNRKSIVTIMNERADQLIYRYVNVFGDAVPINTEFSASHIKIVDGHITNLEHETIERTEEDGDIFFHFVDKKKKMLYDFNRLIEVMA